jgi:hypothetical protein
MSLMIRHRWARIALLRGRLARTLRGGLDLRSRSGNDTALWDILKISLVATAAALVLFVLGPKLITLGQTAVNKVQSPPW